MIRPYKRIIMHITIMLSFYYCTVRHEWSGRNYYMGDAQVLADLKMNIGEMIQSRKKG